MSLPYLLYPNSAPKLSIFQNNIEVNAEKNFFLNSETGFKKPEALGVMERTQSIDILMRGKFVKN